MSTNKLFLWIAAALLSGAFCAVSAFAEIEHPEGYKQLTAVEMAPEQAPMLHGGVDSLAGSEASHREHLPIQLEGAMHKIKKTKYAPAAAARHKKAVKTGKAKRARS
jgi:hypothetical protein